MRVLVGRLAVHEIARIFDEHGDQLPQRNIRRHLGHANRVNQEIRQNLLDDSKSDRFYSYNNGVAMVCDRFVYNALQKSDYRAQAKNLQVVDGGQPARPSSRRCATTAAFPPSLPTPWSACTNSRKERTKSCGKSPRLT